MNARSVALVIPVFQFEEGLQATLDRLRSWKEGSAHLEINIVFSDDGSSDRTPALLAAWIKSHGEGWHLVRSEVNMGKGAAVRRGIMEAYRYEPDFIVFSDCDMYYGSEILMAEMLPALEEFDVVVVDRSWKREMFSMSRARSLASALFSRLVAILTGVTFRDTQGGLKGFRAQDCRPIFEVLTLNGFAFDVEILSIANYFRYRVGQIPVMFPGPTRESPSTVSVVSASMSMLIDLLRVNLNWRRGRYFSPRLLKRVDEKLYTIKDA